MVRLGGLLSSLGKTGKKASSSLPSRESLSAKIIKLAILVVLVLGAVVTVVTVHSLHPVLDPITPLNLLDKLSLWMGVHTESSIVAVDIALFHTTIYSYVFHRHISDGSFHIASEAKTHILPGLFNSENETLLLERAEEVLAKALELVPKHCLVDSSEEDSQEERPPILVKISPDALRTASQSEVTSVTSALSRVLEPSAFRYSAGTSLGTLRASEERVLQWFAINLLRHTLRDFSVWRTAAVLDVGSREVEVTLALASKQMPPEGRVKEINKLSAFGHLVKLVTISFPNMGLFKARHSMLTSTSSHASLSSSLHNVSSTSSTSSSSPHHTSETVHSPCMNPISEASWQWGGSHLRVLGKEEPDYELVKERNGPFAGKKINRPVASHDQCHKLAEHHVRSHITDNETQIMRDLLKGRPVFMEGLLLEKCMERGLTLPYKGGNVRMKLFLDSLQHACKVPNTDQPFGCVDLMYLATLADRMLGFKQSSILHSSCDIEGMTGEWPIAAAFHVYENGL